MKRTSIALAATIELAVSIFAIKTSPAPVLWYDMAVVLLLAIVPLLLVGLMSVDTTVWNLPGIAFGIAFTGGSFLYLRAVFGVYHRDWFQSTEALWAVRIILMVGYSALLVAFIDQVTQHERSFKATAIRLAVLAAIIGGITGVTLLIQWIDWHRFWRWLPW